MRGPIWREIPIYGGYECQRSGPDHNPLYDVLRRLRIESPLVSREGRADVEIMCQLVDTKIISSDKSEITSTRIS